MNETRNDLSFNCAKIDFQAMLSTAQTAYVHSRDRIHRLLSETQSIGVTDTTLHLNAHWIKQESELFAIAGETLATLRGAAKREKLEIVNKPDLSSTEES